MSGFFVRLVLLVTGWRWVRWLFTSTRSGRRVSLRFVAGETLDDAIEVARELNAAGMDVSLNHLGEHVTETAAALAARDDYLAAIGALADAGVSGNISVKPTQLGLALDADLCGRLLDELAEHAAAADTTVTVDMEDSSLTDATIKVYESVQRTRGNLGLALQAYLRRTPEDLAGIAGLGGHIRLCKGAYDEPEAVAYRSRRDVNAAYDSLATTLMSDDAVTPALATHDDDRVAAVLARAPRRQAGYEFQMLYGVRTALQQELVARGENLRIYVPYGVAWYPYLTRRMAERPANLWFFIRALFGR